ncbi:MAG: hypothetical protein H8D24_07165 [Gammaproteobacteria bacterium]|uniref:Uncharacterized protein n=1 Tax=Candidatus Thiopontia autotrophica TaxID=2841688 RepID=A0A8J6TNS5_9GAMM|nr:hypothetical protein [Candidatus Thiopontia autotrophica]MBL6968601.1 hypothetical protein [Gammaproteobacteria bacterium]
MSELTTIEIMVLGVILIFALRYLWRYSRRALGLGRDGSSSSCQGCSQGKDCPSGQNVSLTNRQKTTKRGGSNEF